MSGARPSRHPAVTTLPTSMRTAVGAKQSGTGLDCEVRTSFGVRQPPLLHPCEERVSIPAALLGRGWQGRWEHRLVLDSRMLEMLNEKHGVALDHSLVKFCCYHQPWALLRLVTVLLVFALLRPQRNTSPRRAEADANGKRVTFTAWDEGSSCSQRNSSLSALYSSFILVADTR